ncbi:MAG: toll/interleukin-1 receptor domain-containing protein [Terriglobales bacterium]
MLKLAKDLRAAGAAVWLDQLDIDPGEHWDSAIEKALANSSNMLVVLSPSSVGSTNVMDEVSFALDENKRVIPVLHRDCKVPFRLRRLQYIDARVEYEKAIKIAIVRTIGVPALLVLDTAVTADQTVVAVVSTVRRIARTRAFVRMKAAVRTVIPIRVITAVRAVVRVFARFVVTIGVKGAVVAIPGMILRSDRTAVGGDVRVLHAAVTADQPVIAVVPAVGQVLTSVLVGVPAAVRAEIPVRVIAAVRTIVRVFARLVVTVGVKSAVGTIPGMVLRSGRSTAPGVIAVVVGVVPGMVVDVGVVVVDDG